MNVLFCGDIIILKSLIVLFSEQYKGFVRLFLEVFRMKSNKKIQRSNRT